MLSQDDQVLNINNTVAPGHWADVTEWFISTPMVNNDAHVGGVNNPISIEVNDGNDGRLPEVIVTRSAWSV